MCARVRTQEPLYNNYADMVRIDVYFLSPFSPAVFIIQGVSELKFGPLTVTRN